MLIIISNEITLLRVNFKLDELEKKKEKRKNGNVA